MMSDLSPPQSDAGGESLGILLRKVVRRAPVIALVTIVGALAAFAISARHAKVYEATSPIQLNSISDAAIIGGTAATPSTTTTTGFTQEYTLLTGTQVAAVVARELKLPVAPTANFSESTIDTQSATIQVDASSPAMAARIANAYAAAYVTVSQQHSQSQLVAAANSLSATVSQETARLSRLQAEAAASQPTSATAGAAGSSTANNRYSAQIALLQSEQQFYLQKLTQADFGQLPGQGNNATVVGPAVASGSPISPKTSRDTLLGAVAGLLVGLALAVLLAGRDDRLRDVRSVAEAVSGLPVLAAIPGGKGLRHSGRQGPSNRAEAYRALRAAISYSAGDPVERLQVIGIGDSSTHARVAADLAIATARTGQRTVLLCADVRDPVLPTALDLEASPGFTSLVAGDVTLPVAAQEVAAEKDLVFVGPGSIDGASPELLARPAAHRTVGQLSGHGEMLVVNAAPLPGASDAAVLATMVDSNIVVVELGRTTASDLNGALAMLNQVDAALLGVVVYGAPSAAAGRYLLSPDRGTRSAFATMPLHRRTDRVVALSNGAATEEVVEG